PVARGPWWGAQSGCPRPFSTRDVRLGNPKTIRANGTVTGPRPAFGWQRLSDGARPTALLALLRDSQVVVGRRRPVRCRSTHRLSRQLTVGSVSPAEAGYRNRPLPHAGVAPIGAGATACPAPRWRWTLPEPRPRQRRDASAWR